MTKGMRTFRRWKKKLDMEKIERTIIFMQEAVGDAYWLDESPAWNHPMELSYMVIDSLHPIYRTDYVQVALLHNLIRDHGVTVVQLDDEFGRAIAWDVNVLTQQENESREQYFRRLLGVHADLRAIRTLDSAHVLLRTGDIIENHEAFITRYVEDVKRYVYPLAVDIHGIQPLLFGAVAHAEELIALDVDFEEDDNEQL